jgi:hypothetical protein
MVRRRLELEHRPMSFFLTFVACWLACVCALGAVFAWLAHKPRDRKAPEPIAYDTRRRTVTLQWPDGERLRYVLDGAAPADEPMKPRRQEAIHV